jgi:hypothetical protein
MSPVRPSSLPKLKLCGHYEGDPVSGPAAERGTRLDTAFRALIAGVEPEVGLGGEERAALDWAVDSARILAGGLPLVSDEESLKVRVDLIDNGGTCDLACLDAHWHGDLKSGQLSDYESQMAAYSLGWMDKTGRDEWRCYLFYLDQRYIHTYYFRREEAEDVVREAQALRLSDAPPLANKYCGWCVHRWDCPARREELGSHLPITRESPAWADMDSLTLARFIGFAGLVEEWADAARDVLKARCLDGGEALPEGVSSVRPKAGVYLPGEAFLRIPQKHLIPLLGDVTEEKARAAFAEALVAMPEGLLISKPKNPYLKFKRPAEIAAAKVRKAKGETPAQPMFD